MRHKARVLAKGSPMVLRMLIPGRWCRNTWAQRQIDRVTAAKGDRVMNEDTSIVHIRRGSNEVVLDEDLNIITQVDAPTYADGIYADGLGHIVAINQSSSNPPDSPQTDIFWYYDTDLNFVRKTGGFYNGMFRMWNVFAIIHGNEEVFTETLQDPSDSVIPDDVIMYTDSIENPTVVDANGTKRLIPFGCSPSNAYVLVLGNTFIGFYRTIGD